MQPPSMGGATTRGELVLSLCCSAPLPQRQEGQGAGGLRVAGSANFAAVEGQVRLALVWVRGDVGGSGVA